MERAVERGIEAQLPAADFLVDDGAYFPGPGVGGKSATLIADLVR
jgi:hypothetical protein